MDPKKNPANILDRESLKPVDVEASMCEERDAAHSQNAESCVLGTYSSTREIRSSEVDHYWKDRMYTWNRSKTTLMDKESSPVDWHQQHRDDIPCSRG